MRRGLLLAIVTVALCPFVGVGSARADTVEVLLSAYETPPQRSDWVRLGPRAAERLMEIVTSEGHLPSARLRAVSALASFPTPETRRFLEALLDGRGVAPLFRRKAALALAAAFGAGAVRTLEVHIGDDDPRVRDDVTRALALANARPRP